MIQKNDNIYYLVGDQKIHNQMSAHLLDEKTKWGRKFYFYETHYDSVDWTREPEIEYEELLRQRALQLRSRWKRLCLMFSGGSDSSDVIRVFLENRIPLDELIIFRHKYNPKWLHETDTVKIPLAKWYCEQQPGLKCTVVDIEKSDYHSDYLSADWFEEDGMMTGQMGMSSYIFTKMLDRARDFRNQNDTGYIYAVEKARLWINDGKWYMRQIDKIYEYIDLKASPLEFFHLAPDMPELYVKQCWMLINYLESKYAEIDENFINNLYNFRHPLFQDLVAGSYRKYYLDAFDRTPHFVRDGSNKVGDVKTDIGNIGIRNYAKNDRWKCLDTWSDVIEDLKRNKGHLFNQNDPLKGLVGTWGKPYYIKPVVPKKDL